MQLLRLLLVILVALLLLIQTITASKILGFFITPSQSHFAIQDTLMRGLAAQGHEVSKIIKNVFTLHFWIVHNFYNRLRLRVYFHHLRKKLKITVIFILNLTMRKNVI